MNQLKNDHTHCEFPSEFFDLIFANSIESNSLDIEVRLRNDKHVIQRFYRSKTQLRKDWSYIQAHNRTLGYDVDCTVVPRKRIGSFNKEHPLPELPILNCFWADIDVGEGKPFATRKAARERIIQVGPDPTILVKSGQGLHVYYCLERQKKISVERAEDILKNLAKKLEADPVAARVKRLMRVPNTINHKYGKVVRYAVITQKRYTVKGLKRLWREETRDHSSAKPRKSDKAATVYERFFTKHVEGFARSRDGCEGTGLCPFHNDHRRSFSADVKRGLWKCHASGCDAKGNIKQFCALFQAGLRVDVRPR